MLGRNPLFVRPRPEGPFRRGVIKYIILQYLKDQPSYGYEIIRALEDRFHGLYIPSAGTIYPTLQMLEEMGMVTSVDQDGKKVYTITEEGRQFLAAHSDIEGKVKEGLSDWGNPENIQEIRNTMHELGRLTEMLRWEARRADSTKLSRVRGLLSHAYQEIEDIFKG